MRLSSALPGCQQVSVTYAEGIPLGSENILEKGTTNGTQADFDGFFTPEVDDRECQSLTNCRILFPLTSLSSNSSFSLSPKVNLETVNTKSRLSLSNKISPNFYK